MGVGLRGPHLSEIRSTRPQVGWFEVHAENYLGFGPALDALLDVRSHYPLSLHGVGLSLGSAEGLDEAHLARLAALGAATEPFVISEHLSWSVAGGRYLNDLLPLPYTEESLDVVARNVDAAQHALGRRLLVENPSAYLRFRHSTIPEPEFLAALASRTGCGLLVDVNNVFVTCTNFGADALAYLDALPEAAVGEIHLAGHFRTARRDPPLLVDDHGDRVCDAVWDLYRAALRRFGLVPSLVEWDTRLPPLPVLLGEAHRAAQIAAAEEQAHADAA
ncbi:MAG TPA: DUF692 domain-containing protein [Gammaproteobacteria bacterium]|nr:DUF692 domain-containing protein [Gammaproteobacteria bacterium]